MEKDTLLAANGCSLLFNTGVAHIAEQDLSGQKQKAFELHGEPKGSSEESEEKNLTIGTPMSEQPFSSYISTVEQFLTFRNLS